MSTVRRMGGPGLGTSEKCRRETCPSCMVDVDLRQLPVRPQEARWDFANLHSSGFGVAVDHEMMDSTKDVAGIFVTVDGGQHWSKRDAKPRLPLLRRPSWPVERFASVAVTSLGVIALAWEDPWLFDGSRSHVICSRDRGESWDYHCLGYSNPYLGLDYAGRLLALNDGYYMESPDGGYTWKKSHFRVDWPDRYDKKRVALIRRLIFPEADVGYGLLVHWPLGSTREPPSDIGLLTTADNGVR